MSVQVEETTVKKAGGCMACSYPEDRSVEKVIYQVWLGSHMTARLCPACFATLAHQAPRRMGTGR